MDESAYGWLSLLPPLAAIGLALLTRRVVLSLATGVWLGAVLLAGGNPAAGTARAVDGALAVFQETWQTRVLIFVLLMGSLMVLMQRSGGVEGFVRWAAGWRWANQKPGARLLTWFLGLGVFIESTITCLVAGMVSRPLYDRLRISRQKLAYLCDSTSAPVCMLIPINGWGALVLGLLGTQAAAGHLGEGAGGIMGVFLGAVMLNFYAVASVLLALAVALTGWSLGPMKRAEAEAGTSIRPGPLRPDEADQKPLATHRDIAPRARNMLAPLLVLLAAVPLGIGLTGHLGVRAEGTENPGFMDYLGASSGTTSVFWGVILALVFAALYYRAQRLFRFPEIGEYIYEGAGQMLPLGIIMLLAFAMGMTCDQLGTGTWIAHSVAPHLTPALIAPLVFSTACLIAFSTGTSWGTMAIMIPLAVPLAAAFNEGDITVSISLAVSAVLGGAVFGDHCSPISDTTIVSSMASGCDHIEHVRTQLPYALLAGTVALLLYLALGIAAA